MKKLLLLVAAVATVFACSKDALNEVEIMNQSDDGSGQTRAGTRVVNVDFKITNKTESASGFYWGIASVDFFGDPGDIRSRLFRRAIPGDVNNLAVNASYTYSVVANGNLLLESVLAERIEITFDELTGGALDTEYDVWAEVYDYNGVLATTTAKANISEVDYFNGDSYTHVISLAGIAQQHGYTVKIFVDAVPPPTEDEIAVNGDFTLVHNKYTSASYNFHLSYVKLTGSSSEFNISPLSIPNINPYDLPYNSTYTESDEFLDSVTVVVNETITSVDMAFECFHDIDRYDVGFEMAAQVKNKNGTVLGTQTFTMNEGHSCGDTTYISIPVNIALGSTDEIFVEVTATSIPRLVNMYFTPETYELSYFTSGNTPHQLTVNGFGGPTYISSNIWGSFTPEHVALNVTSGINNTNYAGIYDRPVAMESYEFNLPDIAKVEFTIPNVTVNTNPNPDMIIQAWFYSMTNNGGDFFVTRFTFDPATRTFAAANGTYTEASTNGYELPLRLTWTPNPNLETCYVYWEYVSQVEVTDSKITFTLKQPYIGDVWTWYRIEAWD